MQNPMHKKIQKPLVYVTMLVCVFLFSTNDSHAWAPPEDLTQPFEYGGYTINMPLILAEDSVLWELLEDLDTPRDDDCRTITEPFILAHQTEMQTLFPWLWNEGDARGGADSFCSIMGIIPSVMGQAAEAEGFLSPGEGGLSTNIFDPAVVPNWHTIDGLVFDHPLVRIEFTERIDLLSYEFVHMVLAFAQAFDASSGFLSFDSDMITGLKSTGAIITFKNIENFDDPVILVDGVLDEDLISALEYDPEAKTVTFNTQHFTSFEVVERSSVPVVEEDDRDEDCDNVHGNKAYKKAYQQVKYYKNHDHDLYLVLQSVYDTYRTVGDPARDALMQADIVTYDQYKQYRRYKKYKKCRD
jgi:hypothetical protein